MTYGELFIICIKQFGIVVAIAAGMCLFYRLLTLLMPDTVRKIQKRLFEEDDLDE